MANKYLVTLGRLVREQAVVVVEAKSEDEVKSRLNDVYEAYEGDWEPDTEWGCEPSDSHAFCGRAKKRVKADVKLS